MFRNKGFRKFYIPKYEDKIRHGMYNANPHMDLYKTIPAKLRFERKEVDNADVVESIEELVRDWDRKAWVLASVTYKIQAYYRKHRTQ